MSFVQGKGVIPKGDRYNRSFLVKDVNKKYKKTEFGDFIYSSNNLETGSIGFNTTGKAVISPVYSIFKSKKELGSQFIGIVSARKDFIAKMTKFRQGVVYGQWRIHESDFLHIDIKIPNDEEQKIIIYLFTQLDTTIALHQQKIEQYKEVKKLLMQKIFDQTWRFSGFTDPWEKRKLESIVQRFDNFRVPITASDRIKGKVPYYGANGVQDYVEGFTHDGSFILIAEDGANDLSNYPVRYVTGKIWVNNHAHVLQSLNGISDNKFVTMTLKYIKIQPFLVGSGRTKLNADVLMKLIVKIPQLKEQQQIGTFFQTLDTTIALHQQKLDQLKELKKYLMQNLFV
jgi:type I restriction enzyme S subunit